MPRDIGAARCVATRAGARAGLLAGVLLLSAAGASTGCYAPQLALLKSGLDSLRTQVDTLTVRDEVSYRVIAETRDDVAHQRDLMLGTKASVTASTQEMNDLLARLDSKLDEAMHLTETMNMGTRIEFQRVMQAHRLAKGAYLNLLPGFVQS